jgi:hypothetical protein
LLHLVELSDCLLLDQHALPISDGVAVGVEIGRLAETLFPLRFLVFGGLDEMALLVRLHQLEVDVHVDLHAVHWLHLIAFRHLHLRRHWLGIVDCLLGSLVLSAVELLLVLAQLSGLLLALIVIIILSRSTLTPGEILRVLVLAVIGGQRQVVFLTQLLGPTLIALHQVALLDSFVGILGVLLILAVV